MKQRRARTKRSKEESAAVDTVQSDVCGRRVFVVRASSVRAGNNEFGEMVSFLRWARLFVRSLARSGEAERPAGRLSTA